MINRTRKFITEEIWQIQPEKQSRRKGYLIRQLKISLIAIKGFTRDKIQLRASALTFYSLLSIVPVVAMIFGIAQGFGFEDAMQQEIVKAFEGQKEVMDWVIKFAHNFLQNASGGVIAGVGVILLFWSVMKVLGNIESSFNDIWQIRTSRPLIRKFTDYLSIMLLAPVFLIASSSMQVFISTNVTTITQQYRLLAVVGPIVFFLLKWTPYLLIWLVFTLIYIVMPNTKVRFKSALVAGIIAGTVFQLVQWGYIEFQMRVNSYSAIYGGFAALPLFLIWLQLSWLIVLFGAEISFSNQNVEKYEYEEASLKISPWYKRVLSIYITHFVIRNFEKGKLPVTASQIAHKLEIPIRIVREIVFDLVETRLFTETVTESIKERGFQPARDISNITLFAVFDLLEKHGSHAIAVSESDDLRRIDELLKDFSKAMKKSPSNILLKDI
jgi:membrane protein